VFLAILSRSDSSAARTAAITRAGRPAWTSRPASTEPRPSFLGTFRRAAVWMGCHHYFVVDTLLGMHRSSPLNRELPTLPTFLPRCLTCFILFANEDVVNAFVVAMACYSLYMLCPHDTNLLGLSFAGLCRYRGKVCTGVAPNKSLWINLFGRVVGAR